MSIISVWFQERIYTCNINSPCPLLKLHQLDYGIKSVHESSDMGQCGQVMADLALKSSAA